MLYFYKYKDKYLFSFEKYHTLERIHEYDAKNSIDKLYFLNNLDPKKSRKSFLVNNPSLLFNKNEGIHLLLLNDEYSDKIPYWIVEKINKGLVISINTQYPNWEKVLYLEKKNKWKVNILALGDVGSTLAIGLRLLGGECIEKIGLYDRDTNRLNRWVYELNQIRIPFHEKALPPVEALKKENLFNCHMFIFCASKGIPPVGSGVQDVRMAQFKSNSNIIKEYALMARDMGFNGIFAVLSDPVDLLCKVAFLESNKDKNGHLDFKGIPSDRIIGYGLGVMNGRACFYAEKSQETLHYLDEGRVFGPHGQGLIVANSIENYDENLSQYLTYKTIEANKEIRNFGFKPYVAPSLSSGALSIIATIKEEWFYGSTYMGEAYIGSKCRLKDEQLELEQLNLPYNLFKKIMNTYERLVSII